MKTLILLSLVLLTACAPEKKHNEVVAVKVPLISEIPKGCEFLYSADQLVRGSHEFAFNQVLIATAFDCGVREGKTCKYYLALEVDQNGLPIEDVRCE